MYSCRRLGCQCVVVAVAVWFVIALKARNQTPPHKKRVNRFHVGHNIFFSLSPFASSSRPGSVVLVATLLEKVQTPLKFYPVSVCLSLCSVEGGIFSLLHFVCPLNNQLQHQRSIIFLCLCRG
ncbi:MAG: hypothetical protein JOS17DRAFT_755881 [Linnemannia elongata]|nr:MAG: hypothetical protein JOS17DRAFT_755881 [Linnemannia elongata]